MPLALRPLESAPATSRSPAAQYLARLSPGSRRTMRGALERLAELLVHDRGAVATLPWGALRYEHTQGLRSILMELYAPANINKHLAALRGVLREAWRLEQIETREYQRAIDLQNVKSERLPAGRALSAGEIRALFATCAADASPAGARDAAAFALLYAGGMRRAELVALELADYDTDSGAARVLGKGNKERLAYLPRGGRRAVSAWLTLRGDVAGALLCPVNRGGRICVRQMSAEAILQRLQRRADQAKVARCTPHDFRRSFISDLLDAGADISTIRRLAGHADVSSTARYDRRDETAKRKAVELLHVPYEPPGDR